MISEKKFSCKRISITIFTIFFSFCAISMVTTKLIYDHIFDRYNEPVAIPQALQDTIQQRQVCQFYSGDIKLTGYYYQAPQTNQADALVIWVPGFHAGADGYLWQIQQLREYGWDVFTFDPTGTFQSEGTSQVGFSQTLLDLEAALKYLREEGHSRFILIGHSRGAYAACCALQRQEDIAAVVSVSGVNSAMEAIMHMSVQNIGPISYGNYGFLWLYQTSLFGADILNLNAAQIISDSAVPVLVAHGTEDVQVPVDSCSIISHRDQIISQHAEYLLLYAGHTDILYDADGTANDELFYQIHLFLLRSLEKQIF